MSMFTLYFLIKLDAIQNMFSVLNVSCIILGISWLIAIGIAYITTSDYYDHSNESSQYYKGIGEEKIKNRLNFTKKLAKIFIPILIICSLISTLMPSTKEMAFIYVVSKLSQNDHVKGIADKSLQIPDNALEILNLKMNEYLNEMKEEVKKEVKETIKDNK